MTLLSLSNHELVVRSARLRAIKKSFHSLDSFFGPVSWKNPWRARHVELENERTSRIRPSNGDAQCPFRKIRTREHVTDRRRQTLDHGTLHAAQSYFHFNFANASTLQYGLLSLHWQL
jgi:hypothetical protein